MKLSKLSVKAHLPPQKSFWRLTKTVCLLIVLVMLVSQVMACTTPPVYTTVPKSTLSTLNTPAAQVNNAADKTKAPGDLQTVIPPSSPVNNSNNAVTEPVKTGAAIDVGAVVNAMKLSLCAANASVQPVNADTGYPINERIFIDWNMNSLVRWFKWNLPVGNPAKAVWQVSMMPYDNSPNSLLNPPGLLASGALSPSQVEFSIDFDKIIPHPEMVKANAGNSDFIVMAQENMAQYAALLSDSVILDKVIKIDNALSAEKAKLAVNNTARQGVLNNYADSLNKINGAQNQQAEKPVLVSDAGMQVSKSILESMSTATRYSYFVRVILLDTNDHQIGSPSNSIEVLCGDPIFEERVLLLNKMVEAQLYGTGDFQYFTAIYLDWNSSPTDLTKKYAAPLSDLNNYAYTYFQVTLYPEDPDKADALNPDGLVYSKLSSQIGGDATGNQCAITKIDFSKIGPPADPGKPVQIRYYMRAVHVYSDYANPGFAKLAFSPPMAVNYGAPNSGALNDQYTINIDIGTPAIRFTKYTHPYFGENPSDHAIVTKTPGYPFLWLKTGQQVSIKSLQGYIEDLKRNEGNDILSGLANAFVALFSGIANLITSISDKWSEIQAGVVGALADIGIPPVIGGMLLNAALMAAGIPPTLPNFDDLSNMAEGNIASILAEQSGGYVPQFVAEEAVHQLVDQAKKSANKAVTGLPDDLSSLEGCLKADPSFVWRPATVTIELFNPLSTQIPSGSFLLRFVESNEYNIIPETKTFFYAQTINYPPIKGGKTVTLTIPLDEACYKNVGGGVKDFPEDYKAGVDDTTWNKLILGHQQLAAVITDIQPKIPNPTEFADELGLGTIVFVHFNIIDSHLNIKQNMNNIKTDWDAADNKFPGAIYVSPEGKDTANGSIYNPVKTLAYAVSLANPGDAILLAPGTYQANNQKIIKPNVTIAGTAPGVILKIVNTSAPQGTTPPKPPIRGSAVFPSSAMGNTTTNSYNTQSISFRQTNSGDQLSTTSFVSLGNSSLVLNVNDADGFALKDMQVYGGIFISNSDGVKLENVKVLNPGSLGIELNECQGASIKDCEIGQTGVNPGLIFTGQVIDNGLVFTDCYAFTVKNTNIHDINGNAISISGSGSALGIISNSTIRHCLRGIEMGGSGNKVENTFIYNTFWTGIDFSSSSNCRVENSTLYNTALDTSYDGASLLFDVSPDGPNSVSMDNVQNYGPFPSTFYAENCIIVESGSNMIKVKTNADHSQVGIATTQNAYINKNVYFSPGGPVRLFDQRTHKTYQFTMSGSPPPGISAGWVGYAEDRDSIELNPQIDSQGRSIIPACLGKGVQ